MDEKTAYKMIYMLQGGVEEEGGTSRALSAALKIDNEIGGKTGTGDQRFATYAPGGKLLESRVVNRSATFVFLIGDKFFGTLTAYVHEPYAADYTFTSALMVQLLKSLIPALQPVVAESGRKVTAAK